MSKVKGEAQGLTYKPGEKLPESLPVPDGEYQLVLRKMGKAGPAGWKTKPGKFPNRMLVLEHVDPEHEDEVTGGPKQVIEFASLSPKGPGLLRMLQLAAAGQYPEELTLVSGPDTAFAHPSVNANAEAIDGLLQWLMDNEVVLNVKLKTEEFNGRESNKVAKWLAADTAEATEETADTDTEAAEEPAAEEEAEETEEDPVVPPPRKLAKSGAKMPATAAKKKK